MAQLILQCIKEARLQILTCCLRADSLSRNNVQYDFHNNYVWKQYVHRENINCTKALKEHTHTQKM